MSINIMELLKTLLTVEEGVQLQRITTQCETVLHSEQEWMDFCSSIYGSPVNSSSNIQVWEALSQNFASSCYMNAWIYGNVVEWVPAIRKQKSFRVSFCEYILELPKSFYRLTHLESLDIFHHSYYVTLDS